MSIEDYFPYPPPQNMPPALTGYLEDELERIADRLNSSTVQLPVLGEPPLQVSNGMIAYANGTTWDPGAGEGFYGYEAGVWQKL